MCTKQQRYSAAEDNFIRANYRTMRSGDIAARLGRSEKSIADRLGRKLGLRRWITKPFSKAEDKVILSGRGKTIREIARKLGRAPAVISSRAKRLGIKSWMEFAGTYKEYGEYRIVRERGKRIPEHRVIVGKIIGRDLLRVERVHHINGKKRDNRPRNLHLFPNTAAHSKAHHSITRLLSVLLERRILRFDRNEGIYKLCAIRN